MVWGRDSTIVRRAVYLYCTTAIMHVCTYELLRSTRFDYDNTRLRVGFSWLLLKVLFAKLTVKGVQLNSTSSFSILLPLKRLVFVVCVTNNNILIKFCVFLSACTQYSKINLNLECTCNKYCHLIGHSEVSNLEMLLIQIYKSSK